MSYALYYSKKRISTADFSEEVFIKLSTHKSEKVQEALCFTDTWNKPQKKIGFFADIELMTVLNKEWNERFPAYTVRLNSAGYDKQGYTVEKTDKANFAILTHKYEKFTLDIPCLWYLPILVHRMLGTEESFLRKYKTLSKTNPPIEAAFIAGTERSVHNICNPGIVDLFKAFDIISDEKFIGDIKESFMEKFKATKSYDNYRQSAIFKVIAGEMKNEG